MTLTWKEVAVLVGLLAAVGLASFVGGRATSSSSDGWYLTIEKPTWTPPGAVIGAVWGVLFILMAVAAWLAWRAAPPDGVLLLAALFAGQLVLNVGWSFAFFGLRRPGLALAELVFLWVAIFATTVAFWRVRPLAGALMVPYLAWVAFAGFLNATIWRLNR